PEVVHLTVVNEDEVVLAEWLICRVAQVNDRQAAEGQVHGQGLALMAPGTSRVRPAMSDAIGHGVRDLLAVGLLIAASDSAHVSLRPAAGSCRCPARFGRPRGRHALGGTTPAPAQPAPGRACRADAAWARHRSA